jgi:hypothetical protein
MVDTKPILKRLWRDTCSITEHREHTNNDKSTGFQDVVVLENQPCKLSFETLQAANQT